jgi:inorganic pyrophosphatase
VDPDLRAADWIGRRVRALADQPLGLYHPDRGPVYDVNYGFVPGTRAPDGHPIDVRTIDPGGPLPECEVEGIAIIRRRGDAESKLVGRIGLGDWSAGDIAARTHFQERFFDSCAEEVGGPGS